MATSTTINVSSLIDVANQIISLSEKGILNTLPENTELGLLFANIFVICKNELFAVLTFVNDENLSDENFNKIESIRCKLIDLAEEGLNKSGTVEKEPESANDPNYLFGHILMLCLDEF